SRAANYTIPQCWRAARRRPRLTTTTLAEALRAPQTGPQSRERAVPAEQLHGLVERRGNRPPGDCNAHGRESLPRLEAQPVDERRLERPLDRGRRPVG